MATRLRVLHERDFYRYIGASVAIGVLVSILLAGLVLLLSGTASAFETSALTEPHRLIDHAATVAESWIDPTCGAFEELEPADALREAGLSVRSRTL
jgi:hypothetical protein